MRDNLAADWISQGGVGSKLSAGILSLEHQSPKTTQKTTSGEKQRGCFPPETDGWRYKETSKGLTQKISFATTYPGPQHRWWKNKLERLGTEALERELRK